jgi:ParB/RepB/Spo0J family partition protein
MPKTKDDIVWTGFVSPDRVFPKPDQPRRYFDEEKLKLLARSIEKDGQEHPSKVKVLQGEGLDATFQIVDGERRWRACALIKKPLWVVVCRIESDRAHFRSSGVSNLASEPLSPLETAYTLERVKREYNMTQAEVAEVFCKSAGWANQYLSLLKLPTEIQRLLEGSVPKKNRLSFSVAVALSPFSHDTQMKFVARMRKHKWKTNRALQELRKLGRELGVSVKEGKRVRNPRDDYRILLRFLRRAKEDAEMLLEIPEERFDAMFASRDALERLSTLKSVQEVLNTVGVLQHAIKRATRPENTSNQKAV